MAKRGPGQPKKEPTKVFSLRLPVSVYAAIERESEKADRSMNQQIAHILKHRKELKNV